MATAAPATSEELTCSICLDAFDCPSTLSCGHSFCLHCLEETWQAAGSYSCPQCRAPYEQKPQLSRNVALANLMEQLSVGETAAPQGSCDSCLDGEFPAVRTCLTCEMFFCESHCKRHLQNSRFKDHELVEVGVDTEARKCKRHKKRLEFFCIQDEGLVCTSCAIVGEHVGHMFSSLEEAHEGRKMRVEKETRMVEEKWKEAEASMKHMEAARKKAQESVTLTRDRITGKFTILRKGLDEDERKALRRVDVKERELLSRIDEIIAHHKREISELQATAARLRSIQQERDPLTFLQGHLEESHSGCVKTQILKKSPSSPPTSLDATMIRSLETIVDRFLPRIYGRSPTLDPNSARNKLHISSDLRMMKLTRVSQGRPDHPHRFNHYVQALCSEGFSSDQHYWEVDIGSARLCRIGVTYGTIARKGNGDECCLGQNDVSWSLRKGNNSCSVWHGRVETSLPVPDSPRRVGIHLDWDAGLLSFYNADSMTLLHTFHQTFTQPLYPGLWVGSYDDSVMIVDLSCTS